MTTSSLNIFARWWHRYPYGMSFVLLSIPAGAFGYYVGWLIR